MPSVLGGGGGGVGGAGVTLTVSVFAVGSRSAPPFSVPPLSCTWKVKLAVVVPAGVTTSFPAVMSAALTTWPALTATPFRRRLPLAGRAAIFTAASTPPSTSVKPKWLSASVWLAPWLTVSVASAPDGASLILTTDSVFGEAAAPAKPLSTVMESVRAVVAGCCELLLYRTPSIAAAHCAEVAELPAEVSVSTPVAAL